MQILNSQGKQTSAKFINKVEISRIFPGPSCEEAQERDSIRELIGTELQRLQEESFCNDHGNDFPTIYGDRLLETKELIAGETGLAPYAKLRQYFLRNGREKTFENAEILGLTHHESLMDKDHLLTQLFAEAGMDIEGRILDWLEVPADGRSGGMGRNKEKYGGETEAIMTVVALSDEPDEWVQLPAQKAGYEVNLERDWEGVVNNELSHEIQHKFFKDLFLENAHKRLDEPFRSFQSEVPGLKMLNNAQAAEFLSDVASWDTGPSSMRFFNPLYYMHENAVFSGGEQGQYQYSYKVQRYAMIKVLSEKGHQDAEQIVDGFIQQAHDSSYKNHDDLFVSVREYFKEEELAEIATIYRRIGVQLLKEMKPYWNE